MLESGLFATGNVWDNAAMESFFSLKTERVARKAYRTRDATRADVFDYIECFYNPRRHHSTTSYLSPMESEQAVQASQILRPPDRQQLHRCPSASKRPSDGEVRLLKADTVAEAGLVAGRLPS
jgi:putative transposase